MRAYGVCPIPGWCAWAQTSGLPGLAAVRPRIAHKHTVVGPREQILIELVHHGLALIARAGRAREPLRHHLRPTESSKVLVYLLVAIAIAIAGSTEARRLLCTVTSRGSDCDAHRLEHQRPLGRIAHGAAHDGLMVVAATTCGSAPGRTGTGPSNSWLGRVGEGVVVCPERAAKAERWASAR